MEVMKQQEVRFPDKGLVLVLLLSGLFVVYLLGKPGTPQTVTLVDNLMQGLLEGVGLFLTLPLWLPGGGRMWLSVRSLLSGAAGMNPVQRWVPLLLGLGILSYIIGQAIWNYWEPFTTRSRVRSGWGTSSRRRRDAKPCCC